MVRGLCAEGRTVVLTTHYMDEAQALADTVTVIAAGRVVASGPPDTLGGRDRGETTVRFVLPEGVSVGDLPLPDGRRSRRAGRVRRVPHARAHRRAPRPDRVGPRAGRGLCRAGGQPAVARGRLPGADRRAGDTRETGTADTTGTAGDVGPEGSEP